MSKFQQWREFIAGQGEPDYRYDQLLTAVFDQRAGRFRDVHTLPRDLRLALEERFGEHVLSVTPLVGNDSEQAHKVLFEVGDGERVEAVRLKYRGGWESFCISSQSGCGLGCTFCATGAVGFKKNLTADEITDQLLFFHLDGHKLDSVSLMGMGEPLANPDTFEALRLLVDPDLFDLSARRITVSTVGLVPQMRSLREEFPQVNLVFSLHTPFAEQRDQLMPVNRRYPLEEVMEVLDEHIRDTGRQVSIAYLLLEGVNDTSDHARALIDLVEGRGRWDYLYHVNLIRYNPARGAPEDYAPTEDASVERFRRILEDEGINVTVRRSFGVDIDAACGQLYGKYATRSPDDPAEQEAVPTG